MPSRKLKTNGYRLMIIDNSSVNSLIPYCFCALHLTFRLVFGINFRRFSPINRYKQNTKANVTLINVFLQAKI